MYTKEGWAVDGGDECWDILDPEGVRICTVDTEDETDALLSHLNR